MKTISFYLIAASFAFAACTDEYMEGTPGDMNNPDDQSWLIPVAEVRDGGPGKDGIPALSNPEFIIPSEATYLNDDDLVLGFSDGGEVRAYPHSILDWHEIINDDTENNSIAIIYCPLTGTGIGWDRVINGTKTTFGVSGLLYNSNIIPYDRASDSNWSQLLLKSVNGELIGESTKTYNLIETSWKTWKTMYPNSKVVSTNTGTNRNYGYYPYGSYKTSEYLLFPTSSKDDRLHEKERVLAVIIDGKAMAFTFNNNTTSNDVVAASFANTKLIVSKNTEANLMVAFKRILADGTELSFQSVQNELPVVLKDNEGNKWDVFGKAVSGPRTGQKLQAVPQMMGYWFAFAAFYPEILI
jgi:Protein of unknown function (DUF3179)